jgi:hypothetical protein
MGANDFLKIYQRNKTAFYIGLALLVIAIYFYFKGKKDGRLNIKDAPYIHGSEGIPKGFNPNILADEIYTVMNGLFTLTGTKDKTFSKVLGLQTDDMIIAVYNAFNDKYGKEGKGTLTQWVNDEVYYDFTSGIKKQLINKLNSLRLT